MDKYKQRHSIQNILPEHEEWLKKHQVNDNRTPELFEQYEEEKKKKVLGEYWEAVCFHPVLDLPVKTRGRKIKKHLVREDWIPLSILTGSAGETLMTWKKRMNKPMSVPRCQWLLHTRWLGGTKTAEVRTTLKRQSAHTPDQHHNSCSTSSNCNLLAGWDLLEHLSETFTPIPTSGTRLH